MLVKCKKCGSERIALEGLGTEKLEETLAAAFPGARIARLDRDVATGKAIEKVLDRVRAREVDILVGTQMVTKGHDLPHVTLVGVINADAALSIPDFRAAERAFQLLVQVAGRAGRGEVPGRVLIQTYYPEHYAIRYAVKHDVMGFFAHELKDRKELSYPPFSKMVLARIDALDEKEAQAAGATLARAARGDERGGRDRPRPDRRADLEGAEPLSLPRHAPERVARAPPPRRARDPSRDRHAAAQRAGEHRCRPGRRALMAGMSAASRPPSSIEEYRRMEREAGTKYEYVEGQVYAMSGGTPEHGALQIAVTTALSTQLSGKRCRVFSADVGIRIASRDVLTYPDGSVVCGTLERASEDGLAITNPMVVIEVTSPSSDKYDRNGKFEHYRALDSLREYVLVSHTTREIEVRRREADGTWSNHTANAGERAVLTSIGCTLDVDAIYHDPLA